MSERDLLPPVSLLRLFLKMGGWFVLILGAVLLVLSLIGQSAFNAARRFDAEGLQTVARVTEKYTTESTDSDGDRTVTYWLGLDYTTRAGEEISKTRSVSSGEYRRVRQGDEIDIWYLESDPERTEVTRGSNAQGARVMRIVALVLGAAWLGLLWLVGRWAVEAVRARRYGTCEEAEVTEIYRTSIRVNNRPRYRLKWRDAQGREGKSLLRKSGDLEGYRPGQRVRIYQGLKRAWWAGDIGDRSDPSR